MVSSVSFQNFSNCCAQGVQKKLGNPPEEMLEKLKQAGVPEEVIAKGKESVDSFAKENKIVLSAPPDAVASSKSQGAAHANEQSMLKRTTTDALKDVMAQNNIPSTGNLKEDISAIKATIKGLDKDAAAVLREKFQGAGLPIEDIDKNEAAKKAFQGQDHLASLNKHLLVGKSQIAPSSTPETPATVSTDVMPKIVIGQKTQGVEHANEKSVLKRTTSDALKDVMDKNNIPSTGNLKEDLAAIKAAIKGLDKDAAALLKKELQGAGLPVQVEQHKAVK